MLNTLKGQSRASVFVNLNLEYTIICLLCSKRIYHLDSYKFYNVVMNTVNCLKILCPKTLRKAV